MVPIPAVHQKNRRRWAGCLMAIGLIALVLASQASACPTCKDSVNTADGDGLNLARGYFYSILIMLAMPFMLVSSFGVYVWRETRRQAREAGVAPSSAAPMAGPSPRDAVTPPPQP